MGQIATAFVDITANLKGLETGLAQAKKALASWASWAGAKGLEAGRALASGFLKAAGKLKTLSIRAIFGGIAAAGAGLGYAIKKASDLNETVSALEVTFGKSSDQVKKAADEMARFFGIPKQEFMESAIGFGAIAKAAKMTQAEAAELGVQFTRLSLDLSSMRNLSLETAMEKIRAGLVGEAEPLRTVGVLLSEAAVNQEALRIGLVRGNEELKEGQKITARASIITEQLRDASGDLARTFGELANSTRGLWGRFENLSATIGQFFLPVAKQVTRELNGLFATLEGAVARNREMFSRWGEQLRQSAAFLGRVYRNFGEFKKIAGLKLLDIGKYLMDAFKSVTSYLAEWATYLGGLIKNAIEDGITAAFKGTPLERAATAKAGRLARAATALAVGGPAAMLVELARGGGGGGGNRPALRAPVFQPPAIGQNPEIKRLLGNVGANERAAAIGGAFGGAMRRVIEGAPTLVGRLSAMLQARRDEARREFIERVHAEDLAREAAARKPGRFHPAHGPGDRDVLGRPFGPAFGAPAGARGFAGAAGIAGANINERAFGPLAEQRRANRFTLQAVAKIARQNRAGANADQAAERARSMRMMDLQERAATGNNDAAKELESMRKEAKKSGKSMLGSQEFRSEYVSPAEWVRKLQTGFLSSAKDPAQTTAEYSRKTYDLLSTKLKDGDKILAVAHGLED